MGIAVLGPLSLDVGDGADESIGRRDRMVLAALAVSPGTVCSPERLADVLWGDHLPASWPKLVQGCVVRLRKVLGSQSIETTSGGYRLTIPLDEIDAQRFERAVERAHSLAEAGDVERAAHVAGEALLLWRGPPLVEIEGWAPARVEASRLEEVRRSAEELFVDCELRSGQHERVMAKAMSLVHEAPLRERRWTLLATAQYQAGRQAEALATLRQLRGVLDRELGLEPGNEVAGLEQAILRQDPALVAAEALPEPSPECPYRGLLPYDVDDAEGYFGRDADVAACLRRLSAGSVLAVVGPSGCGKSSLVRAGIAAALRRDGERVTIITPGTHPLNALRALPRDGRLPTLVVDQCEEVFSLCPDEEERRRFLDRLVEHSGAARLILPFRADRLAEIAGHPQFARAVEQGLYLLGAMEENDLRAAIEGPARLASLTVEPGLVDVLVHEVANQAGALPMLSYALTETWKRREGRTLTVAGYRASGGIRTAVAQSAEQIYASLDADGQRRLRDLLMRLVTPGPEGEPVRSRLPRRSVVTDPEQDQMVDLLVSSRLVTSDEGVVEIAHEALARAWPRLRGWLEDDVEGQQILHHLVGAADSWQRLGRPESELYRGVRLAKALEWRARVSPELTHIEHDFLESSARLAERDLRRAQDDARRHKRVNRRLRGVLAAAALFLVGALVAGYLAVRQADRADLNATEATTAASTADSGRAGAKALVEDDIDTSMLLAVAGVRLEESAESRANLLAALARNSQLVQSFPTDVLDVDGLETSPDGDAVLISDLSGQLRLHSTQDGAELASRDDAIMSGLEPRARNSGRPMDFSPDGRTLALGMIPPVTEPVRLLDPDSLEERPGRLPGLPKLPARTFHVEFSADGNSLVAALTTMKGGPGLANSESVGRWLMVWELVPGKQPTLRMKKRLPLRTGEWDFDAVISPDGERVYTSQPLTAYDADTGAVLYTRPGLSAWDLEVSPEGDLVSAAGVGPEDLSAPDVRNVLLVDAETGRLRRRLEGPGNVIDAARFSHDGTMVAATGAQRQAVVWDVRTGRTRETMALNEDSHSGFDFSPDDRTLYTAGYDGAIRVWDLSGLHRFIPRTGTAKAYEYGCSVPAPGGATVMRLSPDGVRFVDTASGRSSPIRGPGGLDNVTCGSWRPDGERYALSRNGRIFVWDALRAELVVAGTPRGTGVVEVDYNGDGSRIVMSEESGRVTMLDAETLRPVGRSVKLDRPALYLSAAPDRRTALVTTGRLFEKQADISTPRSGWALVDLEAGRVIREGTLPVDEPYWVSFSPTGRQVAVGTAAGTVVILDIETGQPVARPRQAHDTVVGNVTYNSEGSLLLSTGGDGSIALWDGRTGELLGRVVTQTQTGGWADFMEDGRTVIMAAIDQTGYVWDTRVEHAIDFACRMAGRDLSTTEWRETFGDRPFERTCPQRD